MSKASARAFAERMKADSEFRNTVYSFRRLDEAKEFIKTSGYIVADEDYDQLSGELTDDALDQVSAGKETSSCPGAGTPYNCTDNDLSRGTYQT